MCCLWEYGGDDDDDDDDDNDEEDLDVETCPGQ